MLEVRPFLAEAQPSCELHPLDIGGRIAPVRLVFTAAVEPVINAALIDLGDRFRLLLSGVDTVAFGQLLPVVRTIGRPHPDLKTSSAVCLYAGGPQHTGFSQALTSETLQDCAERAGVECLRIDRRTEVAEIRHRHHWNQVRYNPRRG